jgi:hypothetical protein
MCESQRRQGGTEYGVGAIGNSKEYGVIKNNGIESDAMYGVLAGRTGEEEEEEEEGWVGGD